MEHTTERAPSPTLVSDTENATIIDASESNDVEKYKRFSHYNRGTWKSRWEENKKVIHRQDNLAILDALGGQAEITSYQKKEARRIFDSLDLQDLGRPASHIAFGVVVYVANEDARGKRYWPTANRTDSRIEWIANNLRISEQQQLQLIRIIENRA